MPSLKDVELKITGVKKTKQITKAMNMVASAKLRSAQTRIEQFRPYADKFYALLEDLSGRTDDQAHPLLAVREEIKTTAIVLITSDRGLCGSFNSNLIREAEQLAKTRKEQGRQVTFYCLGKKGLTYFSKAGVTLATQKKYKTGFFDFSLAGEIGLQLIDSYLNGDVDEVVLIYGEFIGLGRQQAASFKLLPIAAKEGTEQAGTGSTEYIYEPDVKRLLAELLPRFIKVQLYRGLLSTSASEHAARMAAMDNATRACDDMVESLTLLYNKTRQAAITADLMDIVGGAEALNG